MNMIPKIPYLLTWQKYTLTISVVSDWKVLTYIHIVLGVGRNYGPVLEYLNIYFLPKKNRCLYTVSFLYESEFFTPE